MLIFITDNIYLPQQIQFRIRSTQFNLLFDAQINTKLSVVSLQ